MFSTRLQSNIAVMDNTFDEIKVVRRRRLDQVKECESFRLLGSKVIWTAEFVSDVSLFAISEKRKATFIFDERYNCKSMLNATKADRQVEIIG